jgi:glucuronokinase
MIMRARAVGASAKFAGSGGAIIGIYQSDSMFDQLQSTLGLIGCDVLRV